MQMWSSGGGRSFSSAEVVVAMETGFSQLLLRGPISHKKLSREEKLGSFSFCCSFFLGGGLSVWSLPAWCSLDTPASYGMSKNMHAQSAGDS